MAGRGTQVEAETAGRLVVHGDRAHYKDRRPLTRGGTGKIVVARDRRLRRTVAIKELPDDSPSARARFEREALLTARLEHPSIITIHEAGIWPSGEHYYVMKLVEGRSLDQVLAEATHLEDRLALLPHLVAVADAMAYAHRQRVIHRDLKPGNIMIGGFGETVVIDWGLAKDLGPITSGDAATADTLRGGNLSDGPLDTSMGEILGTPAYMAPEQALGLPVDERADVYAIGGILYHLLSGAVPYSGATSAEVLSAVRHESPVPLSQLQPATPPDLLAIVDRAMARDPATRYAHAGALAEDLRRFQSGRLVEAHRYSSGELFRRWVHRYRTPVAACVIALTVVAVLSTIGLRRILAEEQHAVSQRTRAEARRDDVEQLMGFLLGDLTEKLEPIGKLQLLESVARRAVSYYGGRERDLEPPDLEILARARRNYGDVLAAGGRTEDALREHRGAVEIGTKLVGLDPRHVRRRWDLARAHRAVGGVLRLQQKLPAALESHRAAATHARVAAELDPASSPVQADLAAIHGNIGATLYDLQDPTGGMRELEASLALTERLTEKEPADPRWQRARVLALLRVGDATMRAGKIDAATRTLEQARSIIMGLQASAPTDTTLLADLATAHGAVGRATARHRSPLAMREALEAQRSALAIREALVARDPDNVSWQRGVISSHDSVGDALYFSKRTREALAAFRAAQRQATVLLARDPTNVTLKLSIASRHLMSAEMLVTLDQLAEALAEARAARAILVAPAIEQTSSARTLLARSDWQTGVVSLWQGNAAEALAAGERARSQLEGDVARDPNDAGKQLLLRVSYTLIARARRHQRDPLEPSADAPPGTPGSAAPLGLVGAFRAAIASADAQHAVDPSVRAGYLAVITLRIELGTLFEAHHDDVAAISEYRRALAVAEGTLARNPAETQIAQLAGWLRRRTADTTRSSREVALKPLPCAREATLRTRGHDPSLIELVNERAAAVKLFTVDAAGDRATEAILQPGQLQLFSSPEPRVWIITELTGQCVAVLDGSTSGRAIVR